MTPQERIGRALLAYEAPKQFGSPFAAGFDCGRYGANEYNCHFGWFNSCDSMLEWERGKRAAEGKSDG